jgi:FAD/FMN-containing dehydrogenase
MAITIDVLNQLLNPATVRSGDEIGEHHHGDWSGVSPCAPQALLRPSSTEELCSILQLCHQHDQPVVIQGGLTGLSGGATPQTGEVAISLERLVGIEELDTESMTLTALAGTPLQTLQEAARDAGFYLPLDLGARGSCTIGGNVATNAGGTQVIRYGMTRELVLGVEAVLADGTVISSLNKMLKNNAGFDLKHLFIGSEGALGVVTKVVLRLYPHNCNTRTALVALPDYACATSLLRYCGSGLNGGMNSFELMWANYFDTVVDSVEHLQSPFAEQHPLYALIEYQDNDRDNSREIFEQALYEAIEAELVTDAVIAQSLKEAETFWNIRDGIADLLPLLGPVANLDISLPIAQIPDFLQRTESELRQTHPQLTLLVFGHIGDSNLHVCAGTGRAEDKDWISQKVLSLTGEFSGSISAEHGIGVLKKPYLGYSRTEQEIALMKTLKLALDPKQILNPGRVI